ncbi:hypothetical protein BH09SUM1_BH09SUM1_16200 [soil metagenome]
MTKLILDPRNVLIALIACAILTPVIALFISRTRKAEKRICILLAAVGPGVLLYWGFHNFVLKTIGFDSIFSAIIVIAVAAAIGWFAGGWIAGRDGKKSPEVRE